MTDLDPNTLQPPRKKISDKVEVAAGYPNRNPPANNVTEPPKNTSGEVNAVVGNFHKNAPASNIVEQPRNTTDGVQAAGGYAQYNPPANNVAESPVDPRTLPPPDLRGIDEFEAVPPHLNPSSHFDDDYNQLIKDSTQLGYHNPPVAGNLKPVVDSTAYPPVTEGYRPPDWQPTDTSPSATFPSVPIGISPTDGSDTATELGHSKLKKQKSVSNDASLSGNMVVIATGPTNSNQLAVSDNSPVMAAVPLTDQPTPGASQAPPAADSKYSKTIFNYLKDRLQQKVEAAQAVGQTGGAVTHP